MVCTIGMKQSTDNCFCYRYKSMRVVWVCVCVCCVCVEMCALNASIIDTCISQRARKKPLDLSKFINLDHIEYSFVCTINMSSFVNRSGMSSGDLRADAVNTRESHSNVTHHKNENQESIVSWDWFQILGDCGFWTQFI